MQNKAISDFSVKMAIKEPMKKQLQYPEKSDKQTGLLVLK
jgi:hypothetical protein